MATVSYVPFIPTRSVYGRFPTWHLELIAAMLKYGCNNWTITPVKRPVFQKLLGVLALSSLQTPLALAWDLQSVSIGMKDGTGSIGLETFACFREGETDGRLHGSIVNIFPLLIKMNPINTYIVYLRAPSPNKKVELANTY